MIIETYLKLFSMKVSNDAKDICVEVFDGDKEILEKVSNDSKDRFESLR